MAVDDIHLKVGEEVRVTLEHDLADLAEDQPDLLLCRGVRASFE